MEQFLIYALLACTAFFILSASLALLSLAFRGY